MKIRLVIPIVFILVTILASNCSPQPSTPSPAELALTAQAGTIAALSTAVAAKPATATPAPPTAVPPTSTPAAQVTPTLPSQKSTHAAGLCDWASFVSDVTIPDGTLIPPGTTFTKTWLIKNTGTCPWTSTYSLVFTGGDQLGAPDVVPLTKTDVLPGETVQISVPMVAPQDRRIYRSYWKLRNANGAVFGVTAPDGSENAIYTEVMIGDQYFMVANMCSASWTNGKEALPCPGTDKDTRGFVLRADSFLREDGGAENEPALITVPAKAEGGVIAGQFPPILIPEWSRFQATMGCQFDAKGCDVTFKVTYSVDGGPEQLLLTENKIYDGSLIKEDIRMVDYGLVGKSVSFILYVTANNNSDQNRAFWLNPVIAP